MHIFRNWKVLPLMLVFIIGGLLQGCWNPTQENLAESELHQKAQETITAFKRSDPGIQAFFDQAYGYAVFPTIGKGGVGIGGAYGTGEVYEQDALIGSASLAQVTVGLQLGGQAYSEIIFFKNEEAFNRLTENKLEFGAQASAVVATKGASAGVEFNRGIAVFTLPKGGLMFEASIGGQKFNFTPLPENKK